MTATLSRIESLQSQVAGVLIDPSNAAYDEARKLYNAMHDRRPALIVQAMNVSDVVAAVNYAREHDLDLAIRAGGHNVAGLASVDGGLVIDMRALDGVEVDATARTVRVGGGAHWGQVDAATHEIGMATPSGVISTTGVAGLTLGGGFGYLSRKHGLTIDNLLSAEIVTATGEVVTASERENPDLFWAIRGGGGNFGVVTSFEFRLHPVEAVYGGPIFYPASASADVLAFYRDFVKTAPRELGLFIGYHEAPPAPFVPEAMQGHKACMIQTCWTGPMEQADAMLKPIREAGPVALDLAGPLPYPALNSMFDALLPYGLQHYWKADYIGELSDDAIGVHATYGPHVPNFFSLMHLYPLDGAIQEVPSSAMAYAQRDAQFVHIIAGIDSDPANMPANTQWVRNYWSDLHPYSTGAAYVNFLMDEGQDRIRATYRANYPRLVEEKRAWDPQNLFHVNQNIQP
jgi:FAD/FMN-containing dehydrogenase